MDLLQIVGSLASIIGLAFAIWAYLKDHSKKK